MPEQPPNQPTPETPSPASTTYDETAGAEPNCDVDPSLAGQERGDRIETGKAIARAGKAAGHVPGAMERKKK